MANGLSLPNNGSEELSNSSTKDAVLTVKHIQVEIDDISIFYREAGNPKAETIVMLHGFPSSSHMFRGIISGLSSQYHIIAPDYPGFGFSDTPSTEEFEYTFDNIAQVMERFINELKIGQFYLMMQDYGGPVGMRIATQNPNRIKGLIIQNANTYLEGLGEWSQKIGGYVENEQFEELTKFKNYLMSTEGIKIHYTTGSKNVDKIDPIAYLTDNAFFDRENVRNIQNTLFDNYGTNFPKYPEWQSYLRLYQPQTLVIWGENDKYFSKAGGEAYRKDLKDVEIHFFVAGHFMLEEFPAESIDLIHKFIKNNQGKRTQLNQKEKAVAILKALETGDTDALKYINPDKYIQHNLMVGNGRSELENFISILPRPETTVNARRIFQDKDIVFIHTEYNVFGPKAGFDIFRFENDLIVEHWDNLQETTAPNPSGNTLTDGAIEISDLDKTEENKTLVTNFVTDILVNGAFDKMASYFNGDNYIQHNPFVANGVSGLVAFIKKFTAQGGSMVYDKIHQVHGEGNFVLIVAEGKLSGVHTAFYDLFRVENGKIAEHWDILETIPPVEEWKNDNGKF